MKRGMKMNRLGGIKGQTPESSFALGLLLMLELPPPDNPEVKGRNLADMT